MPRSNDATTIDGLRTAYDGVAAKYVAHVTPIILYRERVDAFLAAHVRSDSVVLDVGCGPGHVTATLPPSVRVIGLDLSPEMVALAAQARPAGTYHVHDFHERFPVDSQTVDLIVAAGAFDFCFDLEAVVAELARVARPGARAFLTFCDRRPHDPARRPLSPRLRGVEMALYRRRELRAAFHRHGLAIRAFHRAPGYYNRGLDTTVTYGFWDLERI